MKANIPIAILLALIFTISTAAAIVEIDVNAETSAEAEHDRDTTTVESETTIGTAVQVERLPLPIVDIDARVEISPASQRAQLGSEARYALMLSVPQGADAETEFTVQAESAADVRVEPAQTSIRLAPGESERILITAEARSEGRHSFDLVVTSAGERSRVSAELIVQAAAEQPEDRPIEPEERPETLPQPERASFIAQGFMTADARGELVQVRTVRTDGTIRGTMHIGTEEYVISGTETDGRVRFELEARGRNGFADASFEGTKTSYGSFTLLSGTLVSAQGSFALSAFARDVQVRTMPIITDEQRIPQVRTGEQVRVETAADASVDVRPVRIERPRLFGIIPLGRAVVELEVTTAEGTTTVSARQGATVSVDDYDIVVTQIRGESDIDFTVRKR